MARTRRAVATALALAVATTAALVLAPVPVAAAEGDDCMVIRAHEVFLGREPTGSELQTWVVAFESGTPRYALPRALAASDEWLQVEVTKIYRQALDRDPDADGLAFWVEELRAGAQVTRIASRIYGSGEFATLAGGTDEGVITALYERILHRSPSDDDLAYWLGEAAVRSNGSIAAFMVGSVESRNDRVTTLYQTILGRDPEPDGLVFWSERLRTVNDVRLAVDLASSGEFFTRAQVGCGEPPPPPPPEGTIAFQGRGWGHGRGMSQHGALGYAVDHGWGTDAILAHYYGGTTSGVVAGDPLQRVYLVGSAGTDLTATQPAGRLRVDGWAGEWAAVSVRRLSATAYRVYAATTPGCSPSWTLLGETTAAEVGVASTVAQGEDPDLMLRDCRTGRSYRGSLRNVRTGGTVGSAVVNVVGTEDLLRGIVPREVSPYWAGVGGGQGAAAVRAQAVAARSYLLAGDRRWGSWATTCDSATCQAYGGFGAEDARTDAAVAATAGGVRLTSSGAVARTEFGSSSGGWTAGGAFPAVVDEGDDISLNPYHSWTVTMDESRIESAYPGRGDFQRFSGFVRNGLGPLGGRVTRVTLVFASGTLTQTGDQVRAALGLRSDWWAA
ncbi:DUF4214 domain-containing protein [Iamia sp. SCSIO 61187]|uniref:DUF4214 domain-containing protein n=1 Tax=Iamia sp. SCSIO 61187 TaxID=2722752 RepID=UPI001C63389C|nr:DUF4214 domain-containing protein [Iamia sp. SCSIO 61187]QYG93390.1 DUF4214 domain-containing protein [Iamia sp. SCSIO 61187]